jgi:hypothetical protein
MRKVTITVPMVFVMNSLTGQKLKCFLDALVDPFITFLSTRTGENIYEFNL